MERRLKAQAYDCVVIAGIRLPPRSLSMFEAVINAAHSAAPRHYRVQHAPGGQRRCCRPLAKGGLNKQGRISIDAPSRPWRLGRLHGHGNGGAGPSTHCRPSATGSMRQNATYPGNRVDDRLPLFALRPFPRIIFAGWEGDGDMSEDRRARAGQLPNVGLPKGGVILRSCKFLGIFNSRTQTVSGKDMSTAKRPPMARAR